MGDVIWCCWVGCPKTIKSTKIQKKWWWWPRIAKPCWVMPYDMAEADVLAKASTSTFSNGSADVVEKKKPITAAAVRRNEEEGLRSILRFLLLRKLEQMWSRAMHTTQLTHHQPGRPVCTEKEFSSTQSNTTFGTSSQHYSWDCRLRSFVSNARGAVLTNARGNCCNHENH